MLLLSNKRTRDIGVGNLNRWANFKIESYNEVLIGFAVMYVNHRALKSILCLSQVAKDEGTTLEFWCRCQDSLISIGLACVSRWRTVELSCNRLTQALARTGLSRPVHYE